MLVISACMALSGLVVLALASRGRSEEFSPDVVVVPDRPKSTDTVV
jgi:hypothetical protein